MITAKKYSTKNLTTSKLVEQLEEETGFSVSQFARLKVKAGGTKEEYLNALAKAHTLISIEGKKQPFISIDVSSTRRFERWKKHQELNRVFAGARVASGACKRVSFGFFPANIAVQKSLFMNNCEAASRFSSTEDLFRNDIVIGYGPCDFEIEIFADFDLDIDHDFGWIDSLGQRVEHYTAESRTLVRKSMTDRTNYELVIDKNGLCRPVDIYKYLYVVAQT